MSIIIKGIIGVAKYINRGMGFGGQDMKHPGHVLSKTLEHSVEHIEYVKEKKHLKKWRSASEWANDVEDQHLNSTIRQGNVKWFAWVVAILTTTFTTCICLTNLLESVDSPRLMLWYSVGSIYGTLMVLWMWKNLIAVDRDVICLKARKEELMAS